MQMEFVICEMNTDHAASVTHLSKQLGYKISIAETANNIQLLLNKKDTEAFVAVHENNIVGWISVAYIVTVSSSPFCEIRGLVVDEAYRKKNIGKLLIEKVKQWCRAQNCERLRLRCNMKRKETHDFYLHLGFTKMKEQTVFEIEV